MNYTELMEPQIKLEHTHTHEEQKKKKESSKRLYSNKTIKTANYLLIRLKRQSKQN